MCLGVSEIFCEIEENLTRRRGKEKCEVKASDGEEDEDKVWGEVSLGVGEKGKIKEKHRQR